MPLLVHVTNLAFKILGDVGIVGPKITTIITNLSQILTFIAPFHIFIAAVIVPITLPFLLSGKFIVSSIHLTRLFQDTCR